MNLSLDIIDEQSLLLLLIPSSFIDLELSMHDWSIEYSTGFSV